MNCLPFNCGGASGAVSMLVKNQSILGSAERAFSVRKVLKETRGPLREAWVEPAVRMKRLLVCGGLACLWRLGLSVAGSCKKLSRVIFLPRLLEAQTVRAVTIFCFLKKLRSLYRDSATRYGSRGQHCPSSAGNWRRGRHRGKGAACQDIISVGFRVIPTEVAVFCHLFKLCHYP